MIYYGFDYKDQPDDVKEEDEPKLVNAVLDRIAKQVRGETKK